MVGGRLVTAFLYTTAARPVRKNRRGESSVRVNWMNAPPVP